MGTLSSGTNPENEPNTEPVANCPLCGSSGSTFKFRMYDRLYRLPGEFGLIECEGCGLFRLSPRPDIASIGLYYPNSYGAYVTPKVTTANGASFMTTIREGIRHSVLSTLGYKTDPLSLWQRLLQPWFVKRFYRQATYSYGDRFPRFVPNGRALEVGCGNCTYLGMLKRHGWAVTGVDMSVEAAKKAKSAFDIDVFVGQLEEAPLESEYFDYVHLSHVVEHFFNPLETMQMIVRLLKPGGVAYIEVPNGSGVGAELSGEFWYGWDAPRHLYTFTPDTCKLLLEMSGLDLKRMVTGISDTFEWELAFRREDESNTLLERPPILSSIDAKELKAKRYRAEVLFSERPLSGDYIACWAEKPFKTAFNQSV